MTVTVDTSERPFTCAVCGSSFQRQDVLKRHMKSLHDKEIEKFSAFKHKSLEDFNKVVVAEENPDRKRQRRECHNSNMPHKTHGMVFYIHAL